MRFLSLNILRSMLVVLSCMAFQQAFASKPWDGRWGFQDEQSSGIIYLSSSPDGRWAYSDDGVLERPFFLDGKMHRFGSWATEYSATQPDAKTLLLTEGEHGYDYGWWKFHLSPDDTGLSITTQRQAFSGAKHSATQEYVRTGGGHCFQGFWKPAPKPSQTAPPEPKSTSTPSASQPSYVIWTDSDGVISWYYPQTGELDRGKADGTIRPILGPLNDGESFSYRIPTPNSFEFSAYDEGEPVLRSLQEISPDGQTLTETYWHLGHEET